MSLLSLFIASLLGSLHCAGMCGGFAAFCCSGATSRSAVISMYNIGRLTSYAILGISAGIVGQTINQGLSPYFSNGLAILVGIFLILWGGRNLLGLRSTRTISGSSTSSGLYSRILNRVMNFAPTPRAYVIGLVTVLLPCPWLYGFVALAAASGSWWQGGIVMAVFWLGTLPVLVAVGAFSRQVLERWGAQAPAVTSGLLIASGIFCILAHTDVISLHGDHHGHAGHGASHDSHAHHASH